MNAQRRYFSRSALLLMTFVLGLGSATSLLAQQPKRTPFRGPPGAIPAGGRTPIPTRTPVNRSPGNQPGRGAKAAVEAPQVAPPPEESIERAANMPDPSESLELPEVETEQETVTIILKQQDIESVFDIIREKTGVVVRAKGQVPGTQVDLRVQNEPVETILNQLVTDHEDWTWAKFESDGHYEMWDKESFVQDVLREQVIRRVFQLYHVPATEVQPALEGVKSEIGIVAANPRTNQIVVTDLPDKVALIESLVKEIDVPLYTRTFRVKFADFEMIQESLEGLLSEGGTMQLDPINRQIIVTDTFQKIKQMEQIINQLDVDRPIMLYNLNNIGLDAADADELIENFIVPLATADALIEFSQSQSRLIVQDVPEIHDRILELLVALDDTPPQVWIEGEILEVSTTFDFTWGTSFSYSPDLPAAIADGLIDGFNAVTNGSSEGDEGGGSGGSSDGDSDSGSSLNFSDGFPVVDVSSGGIRMRDLSGNFKVEMNAMMTDANTRLLLQPRSLVRNGEEVIIDLTEENPQVTTFFNNGFSNNNTSNFGSSSITFVPTGVTMALTPTVSNRGLIEMDVDLENSTPIFVDNIDTPQGPQDAVGRNTQRIQTVLIIPSGETRVLGGLIRRSSSETKSGIPILSKIPFIGPLFGSRTDGKTARNLLFFLTPTIVDERPQIDTIQIPVNPAAINLAVEEAKRADESQIEELPEELQVFLRGSSPISAEDAASYSVIDLVEDGMIEPDDVDFEEIQGILMDDDYLDEAEDLMGLTGPGAELLNKGPLGPEGQIGQAGGRGVVGRRAQPARPAPGTYPGAQPRPRVTPQPVRNSSGGRGRPTGNPLPVTVPPGGGGLNAVSPGQTETVR